MKKQLLALAIAATTAFAGMAETVAFVAQGASYSGEGETTTISNAAGATNLFGSSPTKGDTAPFTNGDITITFEKNNNSHSQVNGNQIRWYQNDVITITPLNGATVTNVTLIASESKYYSTKVNVVTGSTEGTLSTGSATRTWNGSTVDEITLTAGAQTRFTSLEVTYTPGVTAAVEKPVIELVEGDYGFKVELSCETEGAEIRYTTNGDEPTEASMLYTVPFDVWENVTVKAIAIKGEDKSAVATKALEVPMLLEDLSGLAGADEETIAAMGGSVKFILNGKLTYVWQGNNNLYLTDGTYYVKCFGYNQPTYAAGDTFTRLEGTYAFRYTQPQVTNFTLSEATAGTNVIKPLEVEDLSYIASYNDNRWFTIKGITISEVSGKNAKMTDAEGNTAVIYNDLGCEGLAEGTNMTVTGFVGLHTSGVQFLPTEIVNEASEEVVAEPVFSLESGEYTENTEIVISCPTEGATIVYTINEGEMVDVASPATIVLSEAMTIHAYATKEGMADSEIVEMVYTIKAGVPVTDAKATFAFSPEGFENISFSEAVTYPGTNQSVSVDGIEMSNNGVSLITTKGTNNPSKIFQNGSNLRCYVGSTLTFSIGSEYTISKVTFDGTVLLKPAAGMPGTFENKVWTSPAENQRAIQQVNDLKFESTGTNKLSSIEVEFAKVATGIESVEVEEGAEAVYYNLQGVRVANPESGLYIRVQGKTASKVYVR